MEYAFHWLLMTFFESLLIGGLRHVQNITFTFLPIFLISAHSLLHCIIFHLSRLAFEHWHFNISR